MLDADEVHVWAAKLSIPAANLRSYNTFLSEEEKVRAGQFHFEKDRNAYIAARGALRSLLGQYLERPAASVEIILGEHGKPGLVGGDLEFNMSHSRGAGLFAFTRGREIGVDVEWMNPRVDVARLAKRSFSAWEYDQFTSLPEARKSQAFYSGWTRKEAFIKALGKGLSYPLDAFDVSLHPDQEARLLRLDGCNQMAGQWTLRTLSPFPEYTGAVVARGQDWRLSFFTLSHDCTPGNTDQVAICSLA